MDFKYLKLTLALLSFIFIVIVSLSSPHPTYAQGTCTCIASQNMTCNVDEDLCDADNGYIAVCPGIQTCFPYNCVCELEDPGINCLTQGQSGCENILPCCTDEGLFCYQNICILPNPSIPAPTPTPAQPPAEITPFQPQLCATESLDPCEYGDPDFPDCLTPRLNGIQTAFGCIPTDPLSFVAHIRDILIGIGSGVALLMMIVGAFFVLTSQGQPEKVERGKEIFIGGGVGLLIIIFSIFLLRLIGYEILGILPPFL